MEDGRRLFVENYFGPTAMTREINTKVENFEKILLEMVQNPRNQAARDRFFEFFNFNVTPR